MCKHGSARLIIGIRSEDGSVTTRAWNLDRCFADHLAAQLGAPHTEAVASPEGVADVNRAVRETPGIVRTVRGAG